MGSNEALSYCKHRGSFGSHTSALIDREWCKKSNVILWRSIPKAGSKRMAGQWPMQDCEHLASLPRDYMRRHYCFEKNFLTELN